MRKRNLVACMSLLVVTGCTAVPIMPSIPVVAGPGRSWDMFQADEKLCSTAANTQIAPLQNRQSEASLGTAAVGTILGAGLGAAIGGGQGAAIGAAGGAVLGTGAGVVQNSNGTDTLQQAYDNTYDACMASQGDIVDRPVAQAPTTTIIVQQPQPTTTIIEQAPPPVVVQQRY